MTFANYNANQLWLQLIKNQQKLNGLVVAVLVIFLLAYAAELTWRIWPEPTTSDKPNTVNRQTTATITKNNLNLADVKKLNLFGDLTAKPVKQQIVTDAPVTRLNLTLTGVVASSVEDDGAAIIENRGQQQTYGIGDKIDGTNATLQEVYADRVIIKNGPQHETLMLDGIDYSKANKQNNTSKNSQTSNEPEPSDQRLTLSEDAIEATRQLQRQPSNFTDYIAVSPQRTNDELIGYRVAPGKKPSLFKAAGLVAGDIITELNGLDLTDIQQSLEAMNMLKELQSLQMTVLREEELITIYLDLPEGEEEF